LRRIALVEPQTLLGQGLQEILEAEPEIELALLGSDRDDFATLREVQGEITVIHPLTAEALAGSDLVIFLGSGREQREAVRLLPGGTPALVVASDLDHPEGDPRVAGITPGEPATGVVLSPHPAVVLASHLLDALGEHDPTRLSGTVLLPASTRGRPALDELFEQTRSILNFSADQPRAIFGAQLAFNLLSGPGGADLGAQVRRALGRHIEVTLDLVTAPVFHGMAASLLVEMSAAPGPEVVDAALESSPRFSRGEAGRPGPIDVVGRDEILVGAARQDPDRPDACWIWAVMDNLTLGGATNAAALARELLGAPTSAEA
jgi:aspartate-semialdehyde dehydrogenase